MGKWGKMVMMTLVLTLTGTSYAFAGQWAQDAGKASLADGVSNWYWQEDDGARAKNCSLWLDGNQDGIYENYTFDEDGWMLANTFTEYGGWINSDGALTEDTVTVSQMIAPRDSTVITALDFTLTLPDNWENHFIYRVSGGDLFVDFYPMRRHMFDGKSYDTAPETMIWLMTFENDEELASMRALGLIDNWRDLGTHNGTYYVSCSPTDTAMEFYTEEERELMQQMRASLWGGDALGLWERMEFHS